MKPIFPKQKIDSFSSNYLLVGLRLVRHAVSCQIELETLKLRLDIFDFVFERTLINDQ